MFAYIKILYQFLDAKERVAACGCFVVMLLMAIVEVVGVIAIMPFVAVLSDRLAIQHYSKLAYLYHVVHCSSYQFFLILLGLIVLISLVVTNFISVWTTKIIVRFCFARVCGLSKCLFEKYLRQLYQYFIERNPVLLTDMLSGIDLVAQDCFYVVMRMLTQLCIVSAIALLLLFINYRLTCLMSLFFGGVYALMYMFFKNKLHVLGAKAEQFRKQTTFIAANAFNNIKDIKLQKKEDYFIQKFANAVRHYAKFGGQARYLAVVPRHLLEVIVFSGILLALFYFILIDKDINHAVPLLGVYVFSFLRLMPAIQIISVSNAQLWARTALLLSLRDELLYSHAVAIDDRPISENKPSDDTLPIRETIEFKQVCFCYPDRQHPTICELNLTIKACTTVGLVGMTGTGKTTLVNLMLGLLLPSTGQIMVDSTPLTTHNVQQWQGNIGYVSQDIALLDDTILNNIAFGLPPEEIDQERVIETARIANIHHVIIDDLPHGYHTVIGHNGIKLSGGQRQRLSMARALYRQPSVLVLDEATSALDNVTEEIILETIRLLSHQKTIIIVAHRLTTLLACDIIHLLQDGYIVASGNYQHLLQHSPQFEEMARMAYEPVR